VSLLASLLASLRVSLLASLRVSLLASLLALANQDVALLA